jgi:MFS family permease
VISLKTRVASVVFVTIFLDLIGFGIVIPLLPVYVKSMGGSAQVVGFILSLFSFTQLVATPVLGRLSDRFGRRPVILLSLAGNAASMVLFAFATQMRVLPILFLSRVLAGATAGNIAACQAAIADVTEGEERAKGMGRVGAAIGLGMVLGPALGGALSEAGAFAPPLGAAALALADLVAAFFWMPETRASGAAPVSIPQPGRPSGLRHALANRHLFTILLLYFLMFLGMTNLQVAMPLLAIERFAWTQGRIGYLFTALGAITLVIQGGLIGNIMRVARARNVAVTGGAVMACGLAAMGLATSPAWLVAGLGGVALGMGMNAPVLQTMASEAAGEKRRGEILGVAQSFGGLARTVGPVLAGFLFKRFDMSAPFYCGAGVCTVLTLLALTLDNEPRSNALRADVPRATKDA